MNTPVIRNLSTGDIERLEQLYYQFWNEHSNIEKMKVRFSKLEKNDEYIFLAAEADGELAGSVMGIICGELYGECRPFLLMEDLIVDAKFRKQGIGKLLIEELERRGKEHDCYQILFITDSARKGSIRFYEKIGFDPVKNVGFKKSL